MEYKRTMKFVDEAFIDVAAGKGGDGCLSFRHEKFIPKGGPDGGNGGKGGSIWLKGDIGLNTLIEFSFKRNFQAQNGESGMGKDRTGKSGDDLIISIPLGTKIYATFTQEYIGEIVVHDEQMLVAKGGHQGFGNVHFKSSVNRAPRKITKGKSGDKRRLQLKLQILADVGLLGMPNAGKSTLINSISNAKPKIADYPFTTLYPNLGVVRVSKGKSFVVADIPGLIKGASKGQGLGIKFLKHLTRNRILLHVLDMSTNDPISDYHVLQRELALYDKQLAQKPCWIIANKMDLLDDASKILWQQKLAQLGKRIYWTCLQNSKETLTLCHDLSIFLENTNIQQSNCRVGIGTRS